MLRRHRKNIFLGSLVFIVGAAYVFAFGYVRQTQHQLGITDEMIEKYHRDQESLCQRVFRPCPTVIDALT